MVKKKQRIKKNISKNFNHKKIILISSLVLVFIVSLFFLAAINSLNKLSIIDLTKSSINKLTGFTGFAVFEEEPEEICEDTCLSEGYNCGTQTICNISVECGSCNTGYECINGECEEEEPEIICSPDCGYYGICVEGVCGCNEGYELVEGVCEEIIEELNETDINITEALTCDPACETGYTCTNGICIADCVDTCSSLGFTCGTQTICNISVECGSCGTGYECVNSNCVSTCTDSCSNLGYNCGTQTVCGASVNCGSCSSDESCESGVCETVEEEGEESDNDSESTTQVSVAAVNANNRVSSSSGSSNIQSNTVVEESSAEDTNITAESVNTSLDLPEETPEEKGFIGRIRLTGLNILKTIKEKALSENNKFLSWSIIIIGTLLFFGVIIYYLHRKIKSVNSTSRNNNGK